MLSNQCTTFAPRTTISFGLMIFSLLITLSGCGSLKSYVPDFVSPYKVDIQQGNAVTAAQVEQLKEGMTRDQVRFLLGTPLLSDIFHTNRWDYVFHLKKGDGSLEKRKLTLFFDDNRLTRYVTDLVTTPPSTSPTEANTTTTAVASTTANTPISAATEPVALPTPTATPATEGAKTAQPATPPVTASPVEPPTITSNPVKNNIAQTAATVASPAITKNNPTQPITSEATPNTQKKNADVIEKEIQSMLEAWRQAWEAQQIDRYLSYYASGFKPQNNLSRADWETQRRERLNKPKKIKIDLKNIRIKVVDEAHARLQMQQIYQSDLLQERGNKSLYLIKENDLWKIEFEQFVKG